MVQSGRLQSLVFWGPPGVGKTTLAKILANAIDAKFFHLSAVSAGKADVKQVIHSAQAANSQPLYPKSQKTVLFLDEIHRFNKAQQDYLLPYVENGTIVLIGATTENPSFEVISPLLSRAHVYVLRELTEDELKTIVNQGVNYLKSTSLTYRYIELALDAIDFIVQYANGDARKALNLLETTAELERSLNPKKRKLKITSENVRNALQSSYIRYDKAGEEHYNTISAFIKSMRASNPDAALYYLARMVDSGEDPLFIARRMVIFASEDIGVAGPTALVVANDVFRACETIGYPECAINLAHGVVYLSQCKKDRRAYNGLRAAQADVQAYGNLPIPLNLRNAPTKLMKNLGYGKGYEQYTDEDLLPSKLKGKKYFKA